MLEYLVGAVLRPLISFLVFGLGRRIIRMASFGLVACENTTTIFSRRWNGYMVGWLPTMIAGFLGWIAIGWVVAIVLDRHA